MLILNPRSVELAGAVIEDVSVVAIDRRGARTVAAWSDHGPHAVFADVPERRVTVRIVQAVVRGDLGGPTCGDEGELVLHTSPTSSDAGRRKVTASVVITHVTHELSRARGAVRTIECVAISEDGASDPITISEAEA